MRMTHINAEEATADFAKRAADLFHNDPRKHTFTDSGRLVPGELFAIRWGMGNDCVVVFRIDEDFEPINFQELIPHVAKTSDPQ